MRCPFCNGENYDHVTQCYYCHRPISGSTPQLQPQPQPQYSAPQPQPPAPVQQPQYMPPQPTYPQPVSQQPTYQQPVPQQPSYQQAPAYTQEVPAQPPKRRSKTMVFGAIVVAVVLMLSIVAAVILLSPPEDDDDNGKLGSTVTAEELCDDWSTFRGTFRSWDDGDKVTIRDEISDIDYITSSQEYGDVSWTIITFESTSITVDDFYDEDIPEGELWGMMIFDGDLTDEYDIGDSVEVEILIADYEFEGDTAEIPVWYVEIMEAYQGNIDYTEINFPSSNRIKHID